MKSLLGKPMLLRQVERVQRAEGLDSLLIATSTDPTDDVIFDTCEKQHLKCFRGNLEDVLDRFYTSASPLEPDHVVRLTADCPLVDPAIVDAVIAYHLDGGFDYTSNRITQTFPDGLDVEVFQFACLERTWREAASPFDREHVTPYMYQRGLFKSGNYPSEIDLSWLRLTVDEAEDFVLIERIYSILYPSKPDFSLADILQLFKRQPELAKMNQPREHSKHVRDIPRQQAGSKSSDAGKPTRRLNGTRSGG